MPAASLHAVAESRARLLDIMHMKRAITVWVQNLAIRVDLSDDARAEIQARALGCHRRLYRFATRCSDAQWQAYLEDGAVSPNTCQRSDARELKAAWADWARDGRAQNDQAPLEHARALPIRLAMPKASRARSRTIPPWLATEQAAS